VHKFPSICTTTESEQDLTLIVVDRPVFVLRDRPLGARRQEMKIISRYANSEEKGHMAIRSALILFCVTLWVAGVRAQEGPNRPEAKPLSLDSKSTAVLVLDLNARCDDPKQVCSKITAPLGEFLDKARASGVPIIYTVSAAAKGKPIGELALPLRRKETEVVIYPDAFDKFVGGDLQSFLKEKGAKTLIVTGSSTNAAVLYTATTATRIYRYNVVIPMDGVNANSRYEHEYAIHQFTVLPSEANKLFQFTSLSLISFR
jgi:nicotinamidase-related amidase